VKEIKKGSQAQTLTPLEMGTKKAKVSPYHQDTFACNCVELLSEKGKTYPISTEAFSIL